jgi:hypothetical protein
MKITILSMIICLTLVGLNAQRLMDSSRSTIGYIENGRVMNSSRSTIGYFENGKVMNSSRSTIGYLDNGRVMNSARSTIGYWENGRVQNSSRSTIGYYEGVTGEHAALFFFFFFYDSNTPKVPTLSTTAISNLGSTTASSGGNISVDGGATVTARGVVWSTNPSPLVTLSTKTSNGTGTGTFTSSLTSLSPNTSYYVRAYATNSAGTAYGNEVSFKTNNVLASVPTLSTSTLTDLGTTTATSGGNVSADGGASVTARGVVWSANPSPLVTLSTKTSNGIGIGTFTSSLTSLSPNSTYYVRAYATNSAGTAYGNEVSFKINTNNAVTSGNLTSTTNISIKTDIPTR